MHSFLRVFGFLIICVVWRSIEFGQRSDCIIPMFIRMWLNLKSGNEVNSGE